MLKYMSFTRFRYICYAAIICMLTFTACNSGEKQPDVSDIKVNLQIKRLDKDLAALDTNALAVGLQKLNQKYPDFLNFFLDTLMGFEIKGNYVDSSNGIQHGLKTFLTNKDYKGLLDSVNRHFPDTKQTDEQLSKGFQYMKYYFPNYRVPQVIYMISWLNNWGAFTFGDTTLGIGLDMFLGDKYPFYKSVGLPDYTYTHLRPAYIPVAAFTVIYQDMHPFIKEDRTLLDMMIQKGKEQYFLKKIVPYVADTTRLGYTEKQLQWCKNSEAEVYNFFVQANLFHEKEFERILRYVMDGPSSTGMPPQSPGNIGSWLGLQIVEAYMKEHPQTTLPMLLNENTDPLKFLQESKYKPR